MGLLGSLGREARALWGGGKGRSLVLIAGPWGLLLGTRMTYPVLIPHLRDDFGLGLAAAGLLVTVLWAGSSLGQLPGGVLADRYSERAVMAAGAVVVALALLGVVTASGALALFVASGLVGLGLSLYPIARITLLAEVYPDRLGSALGVTMATGDLGQTVIPPAAAVLAATVAWQAGLVAMVPLLLAVGVVLPLYLPAGRPSAGAVDALSAEGARYVFAELRRSGMVFVAFVLFLFILVWQSFTGLYPTYLVEEKGLSSAAAGALFSLFFACGIVVKPLSGTAYDRVGLRGAMVLVLVGPVVGFVALPFVSGFWALAGVTALVSTMLGSGAITQSYLAESFAADMRGAGLGVVRTAAGSSGAVGPVAFGALAELGYFDEGYLVLAAVLVVVVLLVLRLPGDDAGV